MPKHVVVIASGESERRALPRLVRHLSDQGILAEDVRIPPRNMALDVEMTARLIKAASFHLQLQTSPEVDLRVGYS